MRPRRTGLERPYRCRARTSPSRRRGRGVPGPRRGIAEQARAAAAPGPEASARIFLGQILLARGERALARAELLTALGIAEKLGDEGAAAHVRALLAQAGGA